MEVGKIETSRDASLDIFVVVLGKDVTEGREEVFLDPAIAYFALAMAGLTGRSHSRAIPQMLRLPRAIKVTSLNYQPVS